MLFGRRTRKSLWSRVAEFVWPRAGVKRAVKYVAHRVARLPGTPYSIAAGFAAGAAVSFTPFIGLHFVLGALIALLIGGNLIASAIGTTVGNPWTFPFIWSLIYTIGLWVLGEARTATLPDELTLSYIFDRPFEVLYPMVIGAVPVSIIAWLVFFWPCYKAVGRYQAMREARRRRARRRPRRSRRMTTGYRAKGEQG